MKIFDRFIMKENFFLIHTTCRRKNLLQSHSNRTSENILINFCSHCRLELVYLKRRTRTSEAVQNTSSGLEPASRGLFSRIDAARTDAHRPRFIIFHQGAAPHRAGVFAVGRLRSFVLKGPRARQIVRLDYHLEDVICLRVSSYKSGSSRSSSGGSIRRRRNKTSTSLTLEEVFNNLKCSDTRTTIPEVFEEMRKKGEGF